MEDSTNLNTYKMPETNVPLLTKEPAILNLEGLAAQIHTRNEVLNYSLKLLLIRNHELSEFVKKEYHMK